MDSEVLSGKDLKKLLSTLERLMIYRLWVDQDETEEEVVSSSQPKIRQLLKQVATNLPCEAEKAWSIPKFHGQLHTVSDIQDFGCNNTGGGPCEAGLKYHVKRSG